MNNNTLLFLLPFLMNGNSGNMTNILTEIIKNQSTSFNPLTFLLLTMMTGKETKKECEPTENGTDAVKNFGGEDVMNMLKILMQNKDQST